MSHLITWMIFAPLAGAAFAVASTKRVTASGAALLGSLVSLVLALVAVFAMNADGSGLQFAESLPWVGSYAINYSLGLDGTNVLAVLLISLCFPVLVVAEWNRERGTKGMHSLLLVLQASFIGAVCAQDLFLLLFFWSLSAVPIYFLVGVFGNHERERAAFQTISSAVVGNALLFLAGVIVYYAVDPHTFLLADLGGGKLLGKSVALFGGEVPVTMLALSLVSLGLALRAPVWPLHGWFVRIAEDAPASVMIAGGVIPLAVASTLFLKIAYPLFPDAVVVFAPGLTALAAINVVMGGLCALNQRKLRSLLAYLCVAEFGFILFGLASLDAAGVVGAIYQQLAFGLSATGFGLFSGLVMARSGECEFEGADGERPFGGLAFGAPVLAFFVGGVLVSLLGFPGAGGFVGRALIIIGGYPTHPWVTLLCGAMMLVASYYLFRMYRAFFLGKKGSRSPAISDLTFVERAYFLPVLAAIFWIGIYPKPLLDLVRPTVLTLLAALK